jgi:hypothetical protein
VRVTLSGPPGWVNSSWPRWVNYWWPLTRKSLGHHDDVTQGARRAGSAPVRWALWSQTGRRRGHSPSPRPRLLNARSRWSSSAGTPSRGSMRRTATVCSICRANVRHPSQLLICSSKRRRVASDKAPSSASVTSSATSRHERAASLTGLRPYRSERAPSARSRSAGPFSSHSTPERVFRYRTSRA